MFFIPMGYKKDHFVALWVWWKRIALLKALGGWGLKNKFHFSSTLAIKCGSRLITNENIWNQVVKGKYIAPLSLEDWLRNLFKSRVNISIVWRVVLNFFDIVNNQFMWRLGDERHIIIDIDPWEDNKDIFILYKQVFNWLKDFEIISISRSSS